MGRSRMLKHCKQFVLTAIMERMDAEKIEAMRQQLELLTQMHLDNEKRFTEFVAVTEGRFGMLAEHMAALADHMATLATTVQAHERRLNG